MAGNVVNITLTSENATQPGFDEAAAGADELAAKTRAAMDEYTVALDKAAESATRLGEVSKDSGATQGEYASALNEATAAADRAAEAQTRLEEAEARQADAAKSSGGGEVGALDAEAAAADRATEAQVRLRDAEGEQAAGAKEAAGGTDEAAVSSNAAGESALGLGSKVKLAGLAMVAGAAVSIKMAADWQESLTQLVTGAGEPVKAMAAIRTGILSLSVGTNTSVKDLTSGLYMISSAGFHGATGLNVLKAAAEGAKAGDASLADVANVLTSAMNAYHEPASAAVSITNQLVATVASGKMHMQDLATSLSSVLPIAASAHISFAQVGGALATMTMQGMTAHRAAMNLANMIRSLISPSTTASAEMKVLGLSANTVAQDVGTQGLTGTLATLTEAILKNMSGGSALAASFAGMTPQVKGYAEAIIQGKMTTADLSTAQKGLSVQQAALLASFAKTAGSATGLKTTYDGAMKAMTGGATGLNVALLLGGKNMDTFKTNVKSVGDAAKGGGSDVHGWALIQDDFNFKLGQAGKALEAVGYSIGDALLPMASKAMGVLADFGKWLTQNKVAAEILAGVIVGVLGVVLGGKMVSSVSEAVGALKEFGGNLASAATSVGKFALSAVQNMAKAAVATGAWIAEHAIATAEFIAQNIAQAASATAAFIAENAATLGIIAGIALLVGAIVFLATHWHEVWTDIKTITVDAWHAIVGFFTNLWHDVTARVTSLWHDATRIFGEVKSAITTTASDLWHDVVNFFTRIWHDVSSLVLRLQNDVVGYFEKLPGRILNTLKALPGDLLNLGKDIIDGLIHGIENAVGGLLSTVKGIAGDISGAFKSVLGIFSPSQVFAQHGRDIVAGLVQGIDGSSGSASGAMRRLAGQLSVTGGGGIGGMAAGGGAGGSFTFEIAGGGQSAFNTFMTEWIRTNVRVKGGGSIQQAFGYGSR